MNEEERNYCCLVLLLNRVGLVKLRKLFIDEWNSLGGFVPWTDIHQNGEDLLTKYIPWPAYEIPKVQSGDTTKWDISLFYKVLLNSRPRFVHIVHKALVDGLLFLKETRDNLCHSGSGKVAPAEFTPLYKDVCSALLVLGASALELRKVEDDVQKLEWNELLLLVKECSHQDKDILQGIDAIHKLILRGQSSLQQVHKLILRGQSSLQQVNNKLDKILRGQSSMQQDMQRQEVMMQCLQHGQEAIKKGPEFEDQAKETNTAAPAGTESGDQLGSDNLEATTKNTDKTDSSNGISAAKSGPITQETEKPKKDKKLSIDDNLEKLWDDPFFQDELCKALDLVHLHSELKDHRHVAHKFDIPPDVQKKIAAIRKVSPSENMFEYLKSTRPDLTIKEFCEKLKMAEAIKPLQSIRSAIEGKVLQNKDLVSQLADKDLTLKNNLILQLDAQMFWRGLAEQFNIPEKKCSTFLRDPDCNLTHNFFLILKTQSPELKVSKLKTYLEDLLEGKEMLKELSKISGESDLKCLNSEAALMCDVIEPMLNSPQSRLLYKLAEKFKKDGYLRGIDIDQFKTTESYESATAKLMEYILTSKEEIYKIRDLKDCLVQIERNDCCDIIMKYVEEAGTENEGHANKENGHKTKTPNAVSETATKETNGDKTDSPVVVSAEAGTEIEGHANKENGNKTDIPFAVSETATKETNGDKTDSSVVVSDKQPIFEAQCIKNKRLGEARQTALLFNKLKILLDPEKPLGGDYKTLADKFGYTYDEIRFLGRQPSPTDALLDQQMHKCTFQTLRKYLNDMERHDAVDKIDEYIKQQGCNCDKCCSIR